MPIDSSGKEARLHLVTLRATSTEYKKVMDDFHKTMSCQSSQIQQMQQMPTNFPQRLQLSHHNAYNTIVSIQRVQNKVLYSRYASCKSNMEQHSSSNKAIAIEHFLWHGTSPDTIDKINSRGFDRGFAGKNGKFDMNSHNMTDRCFV